MHGVRVLLVRSDIVLFEKPRPFAYVFEGIQVEENRLPQPLLRLMEIPPKRRRPKFLTLRSNPFGLPLEDASEDYEMHSSVSRDNHSLYPNSSLAGNRTSFAPVLILGLSRTVKRTTALLVSMRSSRIAQQCIDRQTLH